jgi:glc operon protein GlcG
MAKQRAMLGSPEGGTIMNKNTKHHINRLARMGAVGALSLVFCASVQAQTAPAPAAPAAPAAAAPTPAPQAIPPYGAPLTLEMAKKAMAAAEAEAMKNNWPVAISIFDSAGQPVMFQRLPNTQYASIRIAEGKARTALEFRRPTKALEDGIAAGGVGLRILGVPNVTPLEGGILIMNDGKIIGSIGVSGVLSSQDAMVARAGADTLK